MNTSKYFVYARKSTDDLSRQIRSIDDQIAELRELAKKEDIQVVEVLIEKQTAKAPGRPIFNSMLERIEKGEATGIMAWHPDRLSHNSLDAGRIIHLLDTKKIETLKFSTFAFDPTASGKFMLALMFGQSKYYVDSLAENIKRGQRQKLLRGIWPMVAPIGYLNDKATRTILPDPERAPFVRKAFELYASGGYTFDRIDEAITSLGLVNRHGEKLARSHFHRLLQNPLYYGVIRYGGQTYEGTHEPLISKVLFDKVQEVLTRKSKPKTPELKPFLYRGHFRCGECGCFVTTETQKGHNYLRCTKRVKKDCSQRYVREESIAEQVGKKLRAMSLPVEAADRLIADLELERDCDTHSRQEGINSIRERIASTQAKLDRLMQTYLDQDVTAEEYREARKTLIEQKQELKGKLEAAEQNRDGWFEPALRFMKATKQALFLAESGRDEEKRDFLKKYGSNLTISEKQLTVELRQPFQLVVDQGSFGRNETLAPQCGASAFGETRQDLNELRLAERGRFETGQVFKLLSKLYLSLKKEQFQSLERLAAVLKLHGFLPSLDAD